MEARVCEGEEVGEADCARTAGERSRSRSKATKRWRGGTHENERGCAVEANVDSDDRRCGERTMVEKAQKRRMTTRVKGRGEKKVGEFKP